MNRSLMALLIFAITISAPRIGAAEEVQETKVGEKHGTLHKTVMYLPNRILDVFDIIRLRIRVGPGFAAGARVTEVASAFVGSYTSVYAGLPGPRNRPLPKLPFGLEDRSGIQASILDASATGGFGPDYGPAEIGAGAQLFLIGLDVGADPLETVDLLAGFFLFDLRNDDL